MENPSKSYNDRIEELFRRFPSVGSAGFTTGAYKPGLERMLRFAEALGHPERRFRSIHVAGTNGKGSVCNMLASALGATGLSVGLFTSPHLLDFRERARIIAGTGPVPLKGMATLGRVRGRGPWLSESGRGACSPDREEGHGRDLPFRGTGPAPEEAASALKGPTNGPLGSKMAENALKGPADGPLGSLQGPEDDFRAGSSRAVMVPREYVTKFLDRCEGWFEAEGLSFFEITTGLALSWFADCGVDVAAIEVGLGGRLDSTNIITPDLAIITSIGLDHCAQLGSTLQAIAREKAGIMKPGVPCLIGDMDPETWPVFEEMAESVGCPLYCAENMEPPLWNRREEILAGMDLRGEYQSRNLRTVLSAFELLTSAESLCSPRGMATLGRVRGRGPGLDGNGREACLTDGTESHGRDLPLGEHRLSTEEAVIDGICHTAARMGFRGRWEKLSENPTVICDIAHNPPALKQNFGTLSRMISSGEISSLTIVYGVMADKDTAAIFPLIPENSDLILTVPKTPRAMPADELFERYLAFCASTGRDSSRVRTAPSVPDAIRLALAPSFAPGPDAPESVRRGPCDVPLGTVSDNRDGAGSKAMIYIGGSTYVVAEAIPMFDKTPEEP